MVFPLCRFAGVPTWNIDYIKTPPGIVDIGLIKDEANELAPHRGPRSEVPLIGENLADTIEQDQTATQATFEPTDTNSVESIQGGSPAPSSSRSTPSYTLVPLARIQKLEAQMDTLLHPSILRCRGLLVRRRSAWSGRWPST